MASRVWWFESMMDGGRASPFVVLLLLESTSVVAGTGSCFGNSVVSSRSAPLSTGMNSSPAASIRARYEVEPRNLISAHPRSRSPAAMRHTGVKWPVSGWQAKRRTGFCFACSILSFFSSFFFYPSFLFSCPLILGETATKMGI
ncbi:hypothetical protein B0T26DRAFT_716790 [Lasiosphaeria miniovina]|uniref:Secreted protein n=1 Tax=Lasiosphaeria miniovina TaxID=1954250 RepID=A0AA40ACA3_9PEZI|nr:uncharacterized protein B0T26DRAFT_716790 [Lasiosphaeria miniovina]KAK0713216.1 hypothetical protein B0T26DRAFT_716790 [Lasiosphaeria miniovina]